MSEVSIALNNVSEHSDMMMIRPRSGTRGVVEIKTASIKGYYDQIASTLSHAMHWAPYFRTEDGREVWITNLFYVELRSKADLPLLKKLAEEHAVEVIGELDFLEGWFQLACTPLSTRNALEMANLFYETGLFANYSPNLIGMGHINCINEPLFTNGSLWHLGNNRVNPNIHINFCRLRAILPRGLSNITVAVIDTGTQPNHPDLSNVLPGWDAHTHSAPNVWHLHPHGTMVAGFIGAIPNNEQDVAGIAYGVTILPISFRANSLGGITSTPLMMANTINYAVNSGARVINGSWDFEDSLVETAVRRALNSNVIVVFASGNLGHLSPPRSNTRSPANSDPRILVVGAIDQQGNRWNRSSFCNALDVVAPGTNVIALTTPSGTVITEGTSFSAPQAAAVAAMMLSVNENLTAQEVKNIIRRTANRNLPNFTTSQHRLNGRWNEHLGYGLLDAYAAVRAAMGMEVGGDVHFNNRTVSANQTVSSVSGWHIFSQNVTVTSNATLTFNSSGGGMVTINAPFTVNNNSQLVISVQ